MPTRRADPGFRYRFCQFLCDGLEQASTLVVFGASTSQMAVEAVRNNEVDLAIIDVSAAGVSPGGLLA